MMKDGQLAVFFRNNHFSTMVKEGDSLYLLVTDLGFLDKADVVWETLDSVQGDTVFVDKQFKVVDSQGIHISIPIPIYSRASKSFDFIAHWTWTDDVFSCMQRMRVLKEFPARKSPRQLNFSDF